MSPEIYFAAPGFTAAERDWNARLTRTLRVKHGLTIFLPQEIESRNLSAQGIFEADREGVEHCTLLLAIYDGSDPDSGTAWEAGFAYALGKPIIAVRTDFRGIGEADGSAFNSMLSQSAHHIIRMPSINLQMDNLAESIMEAIEHCHVYWKPINESSYSL